MPKIPNTNEAVETENLTQDEIATDIPSEITQEPLKEVRLLIDFAEYRSGYVAELPESVAKSLVADGSADDSAEAIAYAKSI